MESVSDWAFERLQLHVVCIVNGSETVHWIQYIVLRKPFQTYCNIYSLNVSDVWNICMNNNINGLPLWLSPFCVALWFAIFKIQYKTQDSTKKSFFSFFFSTNKNFLFVFAFLFGGTVPHATSTFRSYP